MLLTGCVASTFRGDVRGFTETYAQVSDRQVLYNLARLNNGLAPYFLTIGPINSTYQYNLSNEATGGGAGGLQRTFNSQNSQYLPAATGLLAPAVNTFTHLFTRSFNVGDSLTGSVESNPEFTYIPLNGDQVAREFLTQISPEIFEHFCQQGWPIDQLLRVLVDRIEIRTPDTGDLSVLTNSPTRGDPQSFVTFLRVCGELRALQRQGILIIRNKKEVEYFGQQLLGNPSAKDLTSANTDGYKWYKVSENAWMIGKETDTLVFAILPQDVARVEAGMEGASVSERNLVKLLETGVSISSVVPSTDAAPSANGSAYIVLRSVSTALSSTATEQNSFWGVETDYPPSSAKGIPDDECRPVIEMSWDRSNVPDSMKPEYENLLPPLLSCWFAGKYYKITDPAPPSRQNYPLDEWADRQALSTWNRDVFRLLAELQSEIGVDLSKYQNEVIQFREQ